MFLKKMMTLTMAGLIPIIKFNSSSLSYPVYPAHRQIMKFNYLSKFPPSSNSVKRVALKPAFCSTVQQVEQQEEKIGISCEPCNGRGWLLCDFCNGQKTNVKSPTNRIYRRCPTCKATGYTLCLKCKVYKCVTFPDENDGEQLAF